MHINYPTLADRDKCIEEVQKAEKHQKFVAKYGELSSNIARFFANIGVELIVGITVLMFFEKLCRRSLLSIVIVNTVSWPLFYLAISFISRELWFLVIAELTIIMAEAAGIYLLNKKSISKRQALIISIACNASTVALSIFIFEIFFDAWNF